MGLTLKSRLRGLRIFQGVEVFGPRVREGQFETKGNRQVVMGLSRFKSELQKFGIRYFLCTLIAEDLPACQS